MEKKAYEEMHAVENTHWWYVGLHNLVLLLLRKYFSDQKLKMLDAGCGTGGLLSKLKQTGHDVAGFDFSDEAVFFCRKRGLNEVIKTDINDWKPTKKIFDVIISMDVLCHKWVRNEAKVLQSFKNGLKTNGLIMLNYPAFPVLSRHHDKVVMIRERYTIQSLSAILDKAGLTPVLISYRLPHAFLVLYILRYWDARKTEGVYKSDIADIPPKLLNNLLISMIKIENLLITRGFTFPFGSSLFVVARKGDA
jgi:SAM-dependent methyltransferase